MIKYFKLLAFLAVVLILIKCKQNKKNGSNNNLKNEQHQPIDKDSLISKIYLDYVSLPKNLDSTVFYNEHSSIIKNIKILEEKTENYYNKQLLKVALFKVYFLSGQHELSLKQLHRISEKENFEVFKKIHLGIYFYLKNDYSKSNDFFKDVYTEMKSNGINDRNCLNFCVITKLIGNKITKSPCASDILNKKVSQIKKLPKKEIIINFFFKNLELG